MLEVNCSFESLCNKVKGLKVLTKKEVSILIIQFRAGDKDAAKKIALHNIRLVLSLATYFVKKYRIDYDNVIGYGVIGLYKAINKFEPDLGYMFSTYARGRIMGAMYRYYIEKRDLVNSYQEQQRFNFESLNDPVYWKGQNTCKMIEDEPRKVFTENVIEKYLNKLPEREQLIIRLKFGFDVNKGSMTLKGVGKEVNLTAERVRQIIAERIGKMKRVKKLRELVDRK